MRYRTLGRTGLEVSTISLGSWLTFGGAIADDTAIACIRTAFELGVNLFDTANVYERGGAEELLGRALAPLPREGFFVATKVYSPMGADRSDRGLGRVHVLKECDASLRRLGTGVIDLYQCHRYDDDTPLEETCRVMDELVRAGKIRHWGVSKWTAAQLSEAARLCEREGLVGPETDQPRYSLLDPGIETDVLPECERLGLGVLVFSPLAQGLLTGKYRSATEIPEGSRGAGPRARFISKLLTRENFERIDRLRALASDLGLAPGVVALAWVLRHPQVSTAIVGATRVEQVEENASAADVDLDEAVFAGLNAEVRGVPTRSPRPGAFRRWLGRSSPR